MLFDISSDNILRVDGQFLQMRDTTPEELYGILTESRRLIEKAIRDMYRKLVRRNEEIARKNEALRCRFPGLEDSEIPGFLTPLTIQTGSVWVMRLAKNEAKVITPFGLLIDSLSQVDRGVVTNWLDLRPEIRPYWEAVCEAGLRPETRLAHKVRPMTGTCLLARARYPR